MSESNEHADANKRAQVLGWGRAAVRTRYYGPTNYLGPRIVAWRADEKSPQKDPMAYRVSWDYALNPEENHRAAIAGYLARYNDAGHAWDGTWIIGAMEDGCVATWVAPSVLDEAVKGGAR